MTGQNSVTGTAPSSPASTPKPKSFSFSGYVSDLFRPASPPPASPKHEQKAPSPTNSQATEEQKLAKLQTMPFQELDELINKYSQDYAETVSRALKLEQKDPDKSFELNRLADQIQSKHSRVHSIWYGRKKKLEQKQSLSPTESDTSAPTSPAATVTKSPPGGLSFNTNTPRLTG